MTPLQRFVHYLIIVGFLMDVLTFVNVKPDLSPLIDDHLALKQEDCEMCDRSFKH